MAKSSSKSKSKNKKKTKKNSNYKNQVVEKKLPKPSEEKIRRQQKAEKEKKKAEIKAAKEALKKEKKLKKENKKKEISKPKKENNKEANKKEKPKEIIKEEIHIKKEESNNTVEEVKETVSVEENLQDNTLNTVEPEIPQKEEEPVIPQETEENIEEETEEISSVPDEDTIEDEEVIEDGKAVEDEEVISEEKIAETEVQNDIPEVEPVPEIKEEKTEKPVRIVEETTVPEVEVKDGGTKIKKEKVKIKLTKKKILVLVAGVVAVAMAVSVIVALCGKVQKMNKPDAIVYNGRNYSEDELYSITIDDEQQETYVKNTKSKGDKGKFKFYAQTEFNLTDISSLIPISLGNPTTEKTVIVATICDEHETTLYRTLGIKPGFYLDEISLEKYLEYGENNLKLYVSAFRTVDNNGEKSYKKVGTQRVNLKVNVGEDFEIALG